LPKSRGSDLYFYIYHLHIFSLHSKPAERFASPPPTPSATASLNASDVNLKLMS